MSRSSEYLAGKKSRHGTQTERKRARTMHILKTRTEKLAEVVAAKVRTEIKEAVRDELNSRGYLSTGEVDREGGGQDHGVSPGATGQPDPSPQEPPSPEEKSLNHGELRYHP